MNEPTYSDWRTRFNAEMSLTRAHKPKPQEEPGYRPTSPLDANTKIGNWPFNLDWLSGWGYDGLIDPTDLDG